MSEEKKFFYANSVEVGVTAYDITLKFMRNGTISNLTPQSVKGLSQPKTELQDEFIIGMSPQHAKALLPVLTQLIKLYEDSYGKLPEIDKLNTQIKI